MGIRKRFRGSTTSNPRTKTKQGRRRSSIFSFISPGEVTEGSLQVWRALPSNIRHDPSMVSFQVENDRLHAMSPDDNAGPAPEEIEMVVNGEQNESEFITMKVPECKQMPEILAETEIKSVILPVPQHGHIDHPSLHGHLQTDEPITKPQQVKRYSKLIFLLVVWLFSVGTMTSSQEKNLKYRPISVPDVGAKYYTLPERPANKLFSIEAYGPFFPEDYDPKNTKDFISIRVQIVMRENSSATGQEKIMNILEGWTIPTASAEKYDESPGIKKKHTFEMTTIERQWLEKADSIRLRLTSNLNKSIAFRMTYDAVPVDIHFGTIYAAAALVMMYVLIIWEIVHRTFAAIISSVFCLAILSILGDKPTMEEVISWMALETLMLLFAMMILIAVLTETGVFDYIAVLSFKWANGKIWSLIYVLCIVTCLISSLLDNVTTILLMTPISIRLCEVMHLNPVPVLMAIVVYTNIGGTLTPVGDPTNIIITSDSYISHHGVSFFTFIEHMLLGVILVVIQTALHFRFIYRDIHKLRSTEPKEIKELKREIMVWQRAADSLSSYSKDVDLVKKTLLAKVKVLRHKLKKKELEGTVSNEDYRHTLEELQAAYPLKNKPLLIKSGFVLIFVVIVFFVQSIPSIARLSLGWSAVLGVILLLIIADRDDMDALLSRVEWTTLLFFAAMFVAMDSMTRLGLVAWIGKQTENVILYVGEDARLAVAILIILWVSALTSAFVDNILITTMMLKVVVSLAENPNLKIPIQPLVWAVAFGPCLGGNGTLYGSSANVVCAGIAEQHGYKLSFVEFFKVVFPMMIGSIVVITGYLMFVHVFFTWH